jgi:hypothetical protein
MELIDYLRRHFLTREQLLRAAGIAGARLDALQQAGSAPRPAYRLRLRIACDSFFGPHEEEHGVDYHARGAVQWLAAVQGTNDPFGLFAGRYREALAALPLATDDALGLDAHLREEWRHFLDGTYGLCTRSGLPEDIAAKEAAVRAIRDLTASEPVDVERLRVAVDLLDRASSPFAPHERARSSRRRLVDDVRARYGL